MSSASAGWCQYSWRRKVTDVAWPHLTQRLGSTAERARTSVVPSRHIPAGAGRRPMVASAPRGGTAGGRAGNTAGTTTVAMAALSIWTRKTRDPKRSSWPSRSTLVATRAPSRNVPLALAWSVTTQSLPRRSISAWRRETEGSSTTRSASAWRPSVARPLVISSAGKTPSEGTRRKAPKSAPCAQAASGGGSYTRAAAVLPPRSGPDVRITQCPTSTSRSRPRARSPT